MSSFANLKRDRNSLAKLNKAIQSSAAPAEAGSRDDTRFWQPTVDKSGNGMAVIRFLPAPPLDGDDSLPWVRLFSHGFQGPGGWYIENSLTTLNQKDPVSEYNSVLWNSGIEANKDIARKQKRKLSHISNIMVVSDPSNPENEGKVFLYKFGKKIFDKLSEAMNPEFQDETAINPFDFWEGANFKLKIRKVEGYRNYDKSEFASPNALFDGDEDKLKKLFDQEYSLKEFVSPGNFKSYDLLKARLDKVLGIDGTDLPKTKAETNVITDDEASTFDTSEVTEEDDLNHFKDLVNN
tara:strand:- start:1650 stop:2531 length:882 start_codon:yes stop_codon:yes gene_type:complete